jgi:4-amino-4-deoxychorismate lyase
MANDASTGTMRWLINGQVTDVIPADDRGLAYGDGLFETMALRDGRIRFLDLHLNRLANGCDRLGIPFNVDAALRDELIAFVADEVNGTLKLIVTRGVGRRGYAPPVSASPSRFIGFAATEVTDAPLKAARVRYCATPISRNPVLAGIKTLNRLEQVVARVEWSDAEGFDEGLMLDDRAYVVCGTMTNLFLVRDGGLMTPLLDECGVKGIMRSQVLNVAGAMQIEVQECHVSSGDIQTAEALFLTNALKGIWPIGRLEGRDFGAHTLVQSLQAALRSAENAE